MAVKLDAGASDEGSYRPLADINVTPLVDVMLVLLIIFMVAAPLMMVGVPVQLPKSSAAKIGQPKQPVVVTVNREGKVFVREEEIPADALVERLAQLQKQDPDAVVYVRGDKGIEYGKVMEVMGLVGLAGFSRLSLIAEGAREPAPAR